MVNSRFRGTAFGAVAVGIFLTAPVVQAADSSTADGASSSAATAAPPG